MSGILLAVFVVAFGFVTAAIITSVYGICFKVDEKVIISFETLQQAVLGIMFFMVSGPYLIFNNGVSLWKNGQIPTSFAGLCFAASLLWSFCLGILMIQLIMLTGIL